MSICDSSEFHDAEILVVAIDRESARAQLKCRLEDGQIRSVRFEGLKAFRSEDLTLQTVVSRVLRSSKAQISRDGMEYWLEWATSLSDADSWLTDERKSEWLTACDAGLLDLVVVEPSAGAQIVALCEKVGCN